MSSHGCITHLPLYYGEPFCSNKTGARITVCQNHFPSVFPCKVKKTEIFPPFGLLLKNTNTQRPLLDIRITQSRFAGSAANPPESMFAATCELCAAWLSRDSAYGDEGCPFWQGWLGLWRAGNQMGPNNVNDGEWSSNACFLVAGSHLLQGRVMLKMQNRGKREKVEVLSRHKRVVGFIDTQRNF